MKILAAFLTALAFLGGGVAQASGDNLNSPDYWETQTEHPSQCYKHSPGTSSHGGLNGTGDGVVLNEFNPNWPGDHWELLVVKGGQGGRNVYPHPDAGVEYFTPNNPNGQPADVSHWIVCKGTTPTPPTTTTTTTTEVPPSTTTTAPTPTTTEPPVSTSSVVPTTTIVSTSSSTVPAPTTSAPTTSVPTSSSSVPTTTEPLVTQPPTTILVAVTTPPVPPTTVIDPIDVPQLPETGAKMNLAVVALLLVGSGIVLTAITRRGKNAA